MSAPASLGTAKLMRRSTLWYARHHRGELQAAAEGESANLPTP